MSTTATEQPEQAADGSNEPQVDETDWKAKYEESLKHSRTWEQRAKENKAAADRLTQIEETQKTAEQKAAEKLAQAEKLREEAEAKVLRRDVALEHKLTADDAALLDTITDEEAMRALAGRLATPVDGKRAPLPDSNQGTTGTTPATPGEQFAAFFNQQISGN